MKKYQVIILFFEYGVQFVKYIPFMDYTGRYGMHYVQERFNFTNSKNKMINARFYLFYSPRDCSKKTWDWAEYKQIKCLWPYFTISDP